VTDAARERRARLTRQRYKRAGVATCLAAVGAAVGLIVANSSASAASGYRTATVQYQTVQQTLAVKGDVEPDHDTTASFQTSGTVSEVYAATGEKVMAGQKLATLDATTLTESEQSAELALEGAKAALTENEDNEASSTSGSSGTGDSGSGTDASADGLTASRTAGAVDAVLTSYTATSGTEENSGTPVSLKAAQAAVVAAQRTVDADTVTAKTDLAQAQTVCLSAAGSGSSTSATDTSASSTSTTSTTTDTDRPARTTDGGDTTTTTAGSTTGAATKSDDSVCTADLQAAFAAQQQVSTDETTLFTDETALAKLLTELESSASSSTSNKSSSGAGDAPSRSTRTSSTKTSSTKTSSTTTASSASDSTETATYDSAEQLASDQATIDSDEAALVDAQQSLAAATLVAPLSGTVAAVDVSPRESVTAGDSSDGITIIDTSGYLVTASLTDTEVQSVKAGDAVRVTIDGVNGTTAGTVTRVEPVDDDDDDYAYPVVIALDARPDSLSTGAAAQAAIVIGSASHVIAVPTSAVHTDQTSYVEVVKNGKMTEQRVTVGVVGTTWTQIDSGLSAGAQVVLADMGQKLPSSSTEQSTTRSFGGAGLPAGGGSATQTGAPGASGGGLSGAG
jgi:RND family efflux transporter MFP subunit